MPYVHIIGDIVGASGFPSQSLFCKWDVVADKRFWEKLEGEIEGQTQTDCPADGEFAVFAHPIDIHYQTSSISGWPKFSFQIWHSDFFGRSEFYGYGFCHLPTKPGDFTLEVACWRPQGTFYEELRHHFLGGAPQLRNPELVYSGEDRYRLKTVTMGTVHLQLSVVFKDFARHGIQW
ncbi:hypothetical protein PROFUN_07511 [Planoprotostelium fungivorum]|uniref:B9 domain-containing protein 2 n=1 Tax=Planoprotostelium fungivorum TaxID=1890364 RepID=A0A2P6NLM0_9EUKA|nr:hypothetical protein PROFUN_07511 [Planoprotostelium fungivorum]